MDFSKYDTSFSFRIAFLFSSIFNKHVIKKHFELNNFSQSFPYSILFFTGHVHSWFLMPYYTKTSLYCLPPSPFANFVQPTPTALFVVLFLWLNGRLYHIWCTVLLNDIMDLQMLSLVILVPHLYVCFLQQGIMFTEVWVLICYHTNTGTHTKTPRTLRGQ